MAVKIAVAPEYADEKRQFHSNRLLLCLLLKKLTALSDIFLTFGSYAPDCLRFLGIYEKKCSEQHFSWRSLFTVLLTCVSIVFKCINVLMLSSLIVFRWFGLQTL